MTKEEMMARAAEAAKAEKEMMAVTLTVDVHSTIPTDVVQNVAQYVAEVSGFKGYMFLRDMINEFTKPEKRAAAMTAIRLSKVPKMILIMTNEATNVSSWIKTYQAKDIEVMVYVHGTDKVFTSEEYFNDFDQEEMILDTIMKSRNCKDRETLENFAEIFGEALGWKFSGPIRERKLTPELFDSFKPYETLPYAGRSMYYYKDQLLDAEEPSGKTVVTPTLKSRLLVGQGVPTEELIAFRDFLIALNEFDDIEDYLEEGWALCECGNPVRTEGLYEHRLCSRCDRPIKDFFAVDINMPAHDYELILYVREHQAELYEYAATIR